MKRIIIILVVAFSFTVTSCLPVMTEKDMPLIEKVTVLNGFNLRTSVLFSDGTTMVFWGNPILKTGKVYKCVMRNGEIRSIIDEEQNAFRKN